VALVPLGFTIPLSVARVAVTALAAPVCAEGFRIAAPAGAAASAATRTAINGSVRNGAIVRPTTSQQSNPGLAVQSLTTAASDSRAGALPGSVPVLHAPEGDVCQSAWSAAV
jgi:hypothetical protein